MTSPRRLGPDRQKSGNTDVMTIIKRTVAAATLLAGAAFAASPAFAAELSNISGAEMLKIVKAYGATAELTTDNSGDPLIQAELQGFKFFIYFYRCDESKSCFDLQFNSTFNFNGSVSMVQVNTYNANTRFGQAYVNADGTVSVDMSATVQGGVDRAYVTEIMDWWATTLTGFQEKVTGG